MTCPHCDSRLERVRTPSPWEFDLWCRECEKRIGTESHFHGDPPPQGIEAHAEPPTKTQGELF